MAVFPKIQSPCPYKGDLADIVEGDVCKLCQHKVHDITDMSDAERFDLVNNAKTELCVSYKVGARSVLAAMAAGAAITSMPLAAQDEGASAGGELRGSTMVIVVGGMRKPTKTEWVKDEAPSKLAELPVVYEDAPAPKAAKKPSGVKAGK
jgi:hypothetical protein